MLDAKTSEVFAELSHLLLKLGSSLSCIRTKNLYRNGCVIKVALINRPISPFPDFPRFCKVLCSSFDLLYGVFAASDIIMCQLIQHLFLLLCFLVRFLLGTDSFLCFEFGYSLSCFSFLNSSPAFLFLLLRDR